MQKTNARGHQKLPPKFQDAPFSSHQVRTFWKSLSHGDAFSREGPSVQASGVYGHCHGQAVRRSGWGMMAICRPSSLQRPTMPSGEPLGQKGYFSVGCPSSSTYRMGMSWFFLTRSYTAFVGKWHLPSPWLTQTPSLEPSMPRSQTLVAADFSMRTVTKRDSKRLLLLCTKRGCSTSGRESLLPSTPGTQPSSASSWAPLQMPRANVSGLLRKALNCAASFGLKSTEPAHPLAESRVSA
mmetsp:Transcript_33862/g.54431  ORF Transcript_33862/g.54431 Transcript_33862/m.54431 type:complete len:239 (-) Transcript_33862:2301-3017(-)